MTTLGHEAIIPESPCPSCGRRMNRSSGVGCSRVPAPGDVSVCIHCAAPSLFAHDMTLRAPFDDERQDIAEHAELQRVIARVKAMDAERSS